MRSVLDRLRGKRSGTSSNAINTQSADTMKINHSRTPRIVVTFVNALDIDRLSNFLLWFLYYDVVKLPESPSRWYKSISAMDMNGWMALGQFLTQSTENCNDLATLHSQCDRLHLDKATVFEFFVRLADHQKMAWTSIAMIVRHAEQEGKTNVEVLELVQEKLQKLRAVTHSLKPTPQTDFAKWKPQIISRLTDFLDIVLSPQITVLRGGCSMRIGIMEEEENQIKYLFEAIQMERNVPLVRYGIFPDPYLILSDGPSTANNFRVRPTVDEAIIAQECDLEHSFSAASLKTEVRILRARVLQLEAEKKQLMAEKEQVSRFNGILTSEMGQIGYGQQPLHRKSQNSSPPLINQDLPYQNPTISHYSTLHRLFHVAGNSNDFNNNDSQPSVTFLRRQTVPPIPAILRQLPQQPITSATVLGTSPVPAGPVLPHEPLARSNGAKKSNEIVDRAGIDDISFRSTSTLQESIRMSGSSLITGLYPSASTLIGYDGISRSIGALDLVATAGLGENSLASFANTSSSHLSVEEAVSKSSVGDTVLGNPDGSKCN